MEPNYRRCISCRLVAHRDRLIRIVRESGTGNVRLHQGMGRSAYLCPNPDCIALSQKKKRLERALKAGVPSEIYTLLEHWVTVD